MLPSHRGKVHLRRAELFVAVIAAVLFSGSPVHALPKTFECSPHTPDANLNEIVLQGTGQLEVKFLETKILTTTGANLIRYPNADWQLCMSKTTAPQSHPCNNANVAYSTSEMDCYHYGVREFAYNWDPDTVVCDNQVNPFAASDYLNKELNFSGNQFEAIILDGLPTASGTKAIDYIRVCKNGCQESKLLWATRGEIPGGSGDSRGTDQCGNVLVYGSNTSGAPIIFARLTDGTGGWEGSINQDGTINLDGPTAPTQGQPNEEEPPPPTPIDHLAIYHDGQALTCAPEEVTIYACLNADCSVLYTGSITVDLSGAGWSSDPVTFSDGSTTVSLRHTAAGTVTLAATATTPAAVNSTRCFLLSGGESCAMSFYKAGFIFDVPTLTANKDSDPVTISAVKSTGTTCGPAFEGSRNVSFWSTYSDPDTGTKQVSVDGHAVATSSPGTAINLSFDANAQAQITVNYPDAGRLQLDAKFEGTGSEAALDMIGNDQFVVKPAGLCVESPGANADCAAGDHTCSAFTKAGEAFSLRVEAVAWESDGDPDLCSDNQTTPNFRHQGIVLSHSLLAPAGGQLGSLGTDNFDFAATDNGIKTISTQSVSEVGVFRFTATPPANGYFLETVPGGTSVNIGRFIPAGFVVTSSPATPSFADGCTGGTNPFTYFGQSFNFAVSPTITVTAVGTSGNTTANYDCGGFWKLGTELAYSYGNAGSPAALTADPGVPQTPTDIGDCNGSASITLNDSFSYQRPVATSPVAPYTPSVAISIDKDDLIDSDLACHEVAGACDDFQLGGISFISPGQLRHGRTKVFNNFGPETEAITASPFVIQVYDGSGWVTSIDDECTGPTDVSFCPDDRIGINSIQLAGGKGTLTVTAGSPDEHLRVCAVSPTWLTDHADCSAPDESCGEFTFGIYRGNDRIINWQEIMR